MVTDSILDSIKDLLGPGSEDTSFDSSLIIFINGALMEMNDLGIGPKDYRIIDNTNTWTEFLEGRQDVELVKSTVYLKVRLVFDPPQNSFLVDSIKAEITKNEWRLELRHKAEV